MNHFPAYICENGDVISVSSKQCSQRFCKYCGSKVVFKCGHCETIIEGRSTGSYGYIGNYHRPAYCPECGKPYPWTVRAIEAAAAAMREARTLSDAEQQRLIQVLPDVISQTPKTQLAAVRVRNAMNSAGEVVSECLKQFVINFGCDMIKELLGLL